MRLPIVILPVLLLLGCTPHPGFPSSQSQPASSLPARFDASTPPVPEIARGLTTLFRDSQLTRYLNLAQQKNPDLRLSLARLEEVTFNTRQAQSARFPSLSANGSAFRTQTNSAGQGFDFGSIITERFSASLDVQWELDVWGRIRAGVTAAYNDQAAATRDYAAARQSIAAQTAQAYFQLIAATHRVALGQRRRQSFQDTFELVDRRFESGTGNFGDVSLARTDAKNAEAQLAELRDSRDQAARLLAALLGSYPNDRLQATTFPSLNRRVSAGIPASLLRRRPDIDAAYYRLRAADARITVAHASLFPSFSLTGSGGRQSGQLQDLTDPNFTVWSLAGNIAAPLFNGGGLRSQLDAAGSRAKQALASYEQVLLNALREVENTLGLESSLAEREAATREALKAAQNAESRVLRNYESGLVEILTVLDTQRRAFATEEALINLRLLRYQNRVALALALGKAY